MYEYAAVGGIPQAGPNGFRVCFLIVSTDFDLNLEAESWFPTYFWNVIPSALFLGDAPT